MSKTNQTVFPSVISVQACQWGENGDHPEDWPTEEDKGKEGKVVRYFRHPRFPDYEVCPNCLNIWRDHGWIDEGVHGQTVCPGSYIVTLPSGNKLVLSSEQFDQLFQ